MGGYIKFWSVPKECTIAQVQNSRGSKLRRQPGNPGSPGRLLFNRCVHV